MWVGVVGSGWEWAGLGRSEWVGLGSETKYVFSGVACI